MFILAVSPHLLWYTFGFLLCTSLDTEPIFLTWKNGHSSGFPHLIAIYVLNRNSGNATWHSLGVVFADDLWHK